VTRSTERCSGPDAGTGAMCLAEVERADGVCRVVAVRPIEAGAPILDLYGRVVERPSRYSVQIDQHRHIELPLDDRTDRTADRHVWPYLNHSCDPNAVFEGLRLIARRPINQREEVTFDYNTTEYEIAAPFACGCGACNGGEVRGFRFVPAERRLAMLPRLAEHLRRAMQDRGVS
jgi:hypothetical protein